MRINMTGVTCCIVIALMIPLMLAAPTTEAVVSETERLRQWLVRIEPGIVQLMNRVMVATWSYQTNITPATQQFLTQESAAIEEKYGEILKDAVYFNMSLVEDEALVRQMKATLALSVTVFLDKKEITRASELLSQMTTLHSTAKVCGPPGGTKDQCHALGGMSMLMGSQANWDVNVWAWQGFRNNMGRSVRDMFSEFVSLVRKAVKTATGNSDYGAFLRAGYDAVVDGGAYELEADADRLWEEVKPLFQHLHAYTVRHMKTIYPNHTDQFPATGHLPAHISGDMYSAQWGALRLLLAPHRDVPATDVTQSLQNQNYTALRLFRLAESAFRSLNWPPMTASFWRESLLLQPPDRHVVCHPSAMNFYSGDDFRIKMCTSISGGMLNVIHHEMGHIEYFRAVQELPVVMKQAANPGFHEAIGEVIALSVNTQSYLKHVGLIDKIDNTPEADLNALMGQALERIVQIPMAMVIDKWRWGVYSGKTPPEDYTEAWWNLRCKYQGVSPPVARKRDDFDPGTIYHVVSMTPYIRYFFSSILQFQFYESLCAEAGHTGPLYTCNFFSSKEAGTKFWDMMALGSTRPWPEALRTLTGSDRVDARPLLEYFRPLLDWLKEQNKGHKVGWDDECPQGSFDFSSISGSSPTRSQALSAVWIAVCISVIYWL